MGKRTQSWIVLGAGVAALLLAALIGLGFEMNGTEMSSVASLFTGVLALGGLVALAVGGWAAWDHRRRRQQR